MAVIITPSTKHGVTVPISLVVPLYPLKINNTLKCFLLLGQITGPLHLRKPRHTSHLRNKNTQLYTLAHLKSSRFKFWSLESFIFYSNHFSCDALSSPLSFQPINCDLVKFQESINKNIKLNTKLNMPYDIDSAVNNLTKIIQIPA